MAKSMKKRKLESTPADASTTTAQDKYDLINEAQNEHQNTSDTPSVTAQIEAGANVSSSSSMKTKLIPRTNTRLHDLTAAK